MQPHTPGKNSDLARSPISISEPPHGLAALRESAVNIHISISRDLRTAAWPCGASGIGCEHSHLDLARSPNRRKASRRFGELSVICGHSHLDLERSGSTQCVRFGFAINGGKGLEVIDNRPRCQGIHNPCNHPRSRVEGTHRYDRPIASWAPYWRTSCVRDHGGTCTATGEKRSKRQGLPVPTDGPGRRRLGQPAVLRDGRLRHRQRGKSSAAKMGFATPNNNRTSPTSYNDRTRVGGRHWSTDHATNSPEGASYTTHVPRPRDLRHDLRTDHH